MSLHPTLNTNEEDHAATQVRLSVLRARHNALADVESFCTGTAAKLKRYAPLLRHLATTKAEIRQKMTNIDALVRYEQE